MRLPPCNMMSYRRSYRSGTFFCPPKDLEHHVEIIHLICLVRPRCTAVQPFHLPTPLCAMVMITVPFRRLVPFFNTLLYGVFPLRLVVRYSTTTAARGHELEIACDKNMRLTFFSGKTLRLVD